MAVTVTLDGPKPLAVARVLVVVSRAAGTVLVLVSSLASVAAVWIGVLWFLDVTPPGIEGGAFKDLPGWFRSDPLPWWLLSIAIAIGGRYVGLRLARRRRKLVIFLRRFGRTEVSGAATAAALRLGHSWRLVALDDKNLEPVGVNAVVSKVRDRTVWLFEWIRAVFGVFKMVWQVAAIGAVVGLVLSAFWIFVDTDGGVGKRFGAIVYLMGWGHYGIGVSATVFKICWFVILVGIVAAVMAVALTAVMLLVLPVMFLLSSLEVGLDAAETSKAILVDTPMDLASTRRTLRKMARRVFSARLMILKVNGAYWRPAVTEVASDSSIVLIDVSEPTENVLWEIEVLSRTHPHCCVFIGEHSCVGNLNDRPDAYRSRLCELLDGRSVLAYTSDAAGMRRFVRGLSTTLLRIPQRPVRSTIESDDSVRRRVRAVVETDGAALKSPQLREDEVLCVDAPGYQLYTVALRHVIAIAHEQATAGGRERVGVDDLWLALGRGIGSIAVATIDSLGISQADLERMTSLQNGPNTADRDGSLAFTPAAMAVWWLAIQDAAEFGFGYVDTEHLLLALVRDGGPVATALGRRGVDIDEARRYVFTVLAEARRLPTKGRYATRAKRFRNRMLAFRSFVHETRRGLTQLAVGVAAIVGVLIAIPDIGATCGDVYRSYPVFAGIGAIAGAINYRMTASPRQGIGYPAWAGIAAATALGLGIVASRDSTLLESLLACTLAS